MTLSAAESISHLKSELSTLYNQVIGGECSATISNTITKFSVDLYNLVSENSDATLATIQFFTMGISYSANHAIDTAIISTLVAKKLNWPKPDSIRLINASLTMNLGMLALQDELYHHKTELSPEQKKTVQDHCQESMRILRKCGVSDNSWLEMVLCHHERPDGSGYPRRLKINDIPIGARIINLADMLDALLSARAYREGIAANKAMHNLFGEKSKFYDAELSPVFVEAITYLPPGTVVETKANETCIVQHSAGDPLSPVMTLVSQSSYEKISATPSDLQKVYAPRAEIPSFALDKVWTHQDEQRDSLGYENYDPQRLVPTESELRHAQQALKGVTIPPMPAAILEIQKETSTKDPSIDKIGKLVSEDVSLAGQVLKLMKSPLLGLRAKITSINHAVMVLGLEKFNQMVLTSAVQNMMQNTGPKQEYFIKESRLTAHCAEKIAHIVQDVDPGEAYMAGLFASCGSLFLCQKYQDYAAFYVGHASKEPYTLIQKERDSYGTDHTALGFLVAKTWQVPDQVCQAIYHHHSPEISAIADPSVKPMVAVLAIATSMVNSILYGSSDSAEAEHFFDSGVNELLIEADDLKEMQEDLKDEAELV